MKKIIVFTWLIFMLSSCASPVVPNSPSVSSTLVIKKTVTPLVTLLSPPTSTVPLGLNPIRRCLPVNDKPIAFKDIASGTILDDNSLLNIQTGKRYPWPFTVYMSIPGVNHRALQVSPDRSKYAHIEPIQNDQDQTVQEILWVVDARAEVLAKIPFDRDDLEQPRWLDDERLIFYTAQTNENGTVLVINPFTGEQKSVSNELPQLNHSRGEVLMTWVVEYSPDLQWVVYLDENKAVTVRDVLTKETLWSSPHSDFINEPSWSPDGLQVAITGGAGGPFYLIDRSGQAKALLSADKDKENWTPSWSPDGRRIAFWNHDDGLMIYDLQSDELVITCIHDVNNSISPLRWSPDGNQLMADGYAESSPYEVGWITVLIDFQKNIVYTRLLNAQGINPDVWMNSLP